MLNLELSRSSEQGLPGDAFDQLLISVIGSDSPAGSLFPAPGFNHGYIYHAKPTQKFCLKLRPGPSNVLWLLLLAEAPMSHIMTLMHVDGQASDSTYLI